MSLSVARCRCLSLRVAVCRLHGWAACQLRVGCVPCCVPAVLALVARRLAAESGSCGGNAQFLLGQRTHHSRAREPGGSSDGNLRSSDAKKWTGAWTAGGSNMEDSRYIPRKYTRVEL